MPALKLFKASCKATKTGSFTKTAQKSKPDENYSSSPPTVSYFGGSWRHCCAVSSFQLSPP